MSNTLIDIGRDKVTINLFDTKGGTVTLYTSLTGNDQDHILPLFEGKTDTKSKFTMALETIVRCWISWNIGKDGEALPCTADTLKQFTQRDIFAMLQACTGRQLLDDNGNMLTDEETAKKAVSA